MMSDVMAPTSGDIDPSASEDFEWDVDAEIQLFYAMFGHKPVGVNKYFNMISIWEKLSNSIEKEITTEMIWKHLDTLYDLNMLDETEPIPFPNDEMEFCLPEADFGELMRLKAKDVGVTIEEPEVTERSVSPRIQSTPRSVSRGATSRENTPKGGSSRSDPRRDSRDSNASAGGRESAGSTKSSSKSAKSTKQRERSAKSKLSVADDGTRTPDSDTPSGSKRGNPKRPTRGSLAKAGAGGEATPPALVPAQSSTPTPNRRRRI